ncbi:hypothetical protein Lqui_0655 [Legionella quinlivanii]|uniref:Dystroglycan-type cadherin-like domain-containing protein n=1 Tax=Legionella quinlivanii TaxID=45073 RepID=A0A0W0Y5L1_9GAMM|nr:hypothetical protein [Legionella quinlivanii]KTD51811.1 hypothetical protein Lqui_0655 [Legionella quinlivanii]SEF67106.1 hypothetical protein SAMN02746093_00796 [Legionella quinlivanii DSM 21216]STY10662.1 Uncharacterised protein [Legionella quinlivanii]
MMKKILVFVLVLKAHFCFSFNANPQGAAVLGYVFPPPQIVYAGEPVRFRMRADFFEFGRHCAYYWKTPVNAILSYVSGDCPLLNNSIPNPRNPFSVCFFDVVIPTTVNQIIKGDISYNNYSFNSNRCCGGKQFQAQSMPFEIKVIPHPLSISASAEQIATANVGFNYNFLNVINYYHENVQSGASPVIHVVPAEQNGLRFDPALHSLIGKPERPGIYQFQFSASNFYSYTAPAILTINVRENPQDKPVFIPEVVLPPAQALQLYQLNLPALLTANSSFLSNNQIRFRFDSRYSNPDWLLLAEDGLRLKGIVPDNEETSWNFTLIASSNAGGDSLPKSFIIERAIDPAKKPVLKPITLSAAAGDYFSFNIQDALASASENTDIKVYLDKVEPAAPWIHYSSGSQTGLEGEIPFDAMGEVFHLTIRAANREGGSSDAMSITLTISPNPVYQPRLKDSAFVLPLAYAGQAYHFDFVKEKTIYPDFHSIPYEIFLSNKCYGISNPPWIRVMDNKLEANIPKELAEDIFSCVQVKNKAGGLSEVIPLVIRVA